MKPKIILASQSDRRAKLLQEAGIPFEVKPTDVDERVRRRVAISEMAVEVATRKANAIKDPATWVLAADTLLDVDGEAIGKPLDEVEAHATLRLLSGTSHFVITGVVIRAPDGAIKSGFAKTEVTFRELTDQEIDRYIRTGEPMDKAGAYGIQSGAKGFVSKVTGPMDNVVGLPMDVVRQLLKETGYPL